MEIKILGLGCPKCKVMESQVKRAVKKSGLDIKITKVEQIEQIMKYNIMSTPGLVVDGKIKVVGRIPSVDEIKKYIQD